ncbi:MAG: hypothetical protein HYZ83_04090 [Candidatus Omnitrophica bacterium]|nr:hypothetical protein [Candidatus Omnitrophota bacterium]
MVIDQKAIDNRKIKQVKSNLNELTGSFIAGTILLSVIGLVAVFFAPAYNSLFASFVFPALLILIVSSVMGLINGRALYWFLFVITGIGLLGGIFLAGLLPILEMKNSILTFCFHFSLLISCFFAWRWGAGVYNQDTMKEVLISKRIDLEKGTYSPFTFPFGVLKSKSSQKWFIIANTSGPLFITVAVVLAGAMGKHAPNIGRLWGGLCIYITIVLFVGSIRAALGEYSWIRNWEKETGRKMYISYVVDWKRYKEQEKQRKPR